TAEHAGEMLIDIKSVRFKRLTLKNDCQCAGNLFWDSGCKRKSVTRSHGNDADIYPDLLQGFYHTVHRAVPAADHHIRNLFVFYFLSQEIIIPVRPGGNDFKIQTL